MIQMTRDLVRPFGWKSYLRGKKPVSKKKFINEERKLKKKHKKKIGLRSELNITHATEIVSVSFRVALGGPGSEALQVSYYPDIASILMQW